MASFWSLGSQLGLPPLSSAKTQLGQFSKDIFFMENQLEICYPMQAEVVRKAIYPEKRRGYGK